MMLEYGRLKYSLAVVVLLLSVLYALPNLYPQDPAIQITANRNAEVDLALQDQVLSILNAVQISIKSIEIEENSNLLVRLFSTDVQARAADILRDDLGGDYIVALNLAPSVPQWLAAIGAKPMLLGLDLQGGVHFLMEVDQKAALEKRLNAYSDDLRAVLRDNGVRYEFVEQRTNHSILVVLASTTEIGSAQQLIATNFPDLRSEVSGNEVIIRVPEGEIKRISDEAIEQNIVTLRKRINELGVSEPIIQRQGSDYIVVELPGVQDTAQAKTHSWCYGNIGVSWCCRW